MPPTTAATIPAATSIPIALEPTPSPIGTRSVGPLHPATVTSLPTATFPVTASPQSPTVCLGLPSGSLNPVITIANCLRPPPPSRVLAQDVARHHPSPSPPTPRRSAPAQAASAPQQGDLGYSAPGGAVHAEVNLASGVEPMRCPIPAHPASVPWPRRCRQ
jgi:hypothetical protein